MEVKTTLAAGPATRAVAASSPQNEKDQPVQQLTRIWQETLRIDPIAPDQNYFDLGGDSSLAVQMFAQIEKTFGPFRTCRYAAAGSSACGCDAAYRWSRSIRLACNAACIGVRCAVIALASVAGRTGCGTVGAGEQAISVFVEEGLFSLNCCQNRYPAIPGMDSITCRGD